MVIKIKQHKGNTDALHAKETDRTLKQLKSKGEEDFAVRKAKKAELPYIDLNIIPVANEDVSIISEDDAKKYNIFVFHRIGKMLKLATSTPESTTLQDFITDFETRQGWQTELFVISEASKDKLLRQYKTAYFIDSIDTMRLTLEGEDLEAFEDSLGKLLKLKDNADALPTTEILNILFSGALKLGASDVHIEPQRETVRIRYRIDGVLQKIVEIPEHVYQLLINRIKLMSKMKINVRDLAQDGHFEFMLNPETRVDVRVSTIPGKQFEGLVMRLLRSDSVTVDINSLGLKGKAFEDIQKNIAKNAGMLLTTGPTGSGKTTTLYTLINHIKTPETKIITIEDPIEYQLDGISQTQVAKDRGYTFSKGLRAVVRQDPDVVLVGEIRDDETADVAINAALTGHLVLSTLHTNNAIATVPRLMELGVKPTLIPSATNIFMAQRLVRTLCEHCKESYEPAQETKNTFMKMISLISPKAKLTVPKEIKEIYRAIGCDKCHGTGYKGRIGIFEILTMSNKIEQLILDLASETDMMKEAIEEGFVTMTQDGVLKALEGVTTIEEVMRVTTEGELIESLYDDLMSQSLSRGIFVKYSLQKLAEENAGNFDEMNKTINDTEDKDMLPTILSYGAILKSSDIHIEPQEEYVDIRMRVDGVLQSITKIPLMSYPLLLSKVKIISDIPTTIRQGVSDSRFRINYEKEDETELNVDVRVSIIVGGYGETIVLRLLNRDNVNLDIHSIGIRKYNLDRIMSQVTKPYGVVLNTGPTGSGKTTTLYSVLSEISSPDIKIITIENPIEYQLDGILQTQIDKEAGYTFGNALRALLRQDPDILLVGEIRDDETATTAINAALTGHLLISSLHTNDAVGAIQRLINLGVSTDDLTTATNAFIAQRLVRVLCSCKIETPISETDKSIITNVLESISPKVTIEQPQQDKLYTPGKCEECNGIGYKGRTVISEIFIMDDDLREMIAHGSLAPDIKKKAVENGMLTMEQDAILKALEGITTLEEVKRVTTL
ncbi:MAG: GspE/PulE family protein [Candidatus Moraniibacteriota bacterium]|jgi:general secretion pathway protein E